MNLRFLIYLKNMRFLFIRYIKLINLDIMIQSKIKNIEFFLSLFLYIFDQEIIIFYSYLNAIYKIYN